MEHEVCGGDNGVKGTSCSCGCLTESAECSTAAGCTLRIGRVIQEGRGRRRRWEERDVLEAGYAVAEQMELGQVTSSIQV